MLQYIMRQYGFGALDEFSFAVLMTLVEQIPASDILMGKPMPICAASAFLRLAQPANAQPVFCARTAIAVAYRYA